MINHNLEVVNVDPKRLIPHSTNARLHSRRQVQQIKASIKSVGFVSPILIDEHYNIIAGHGRLLAVIDLGLDEVPTIMLCGLWPAQIAALRLADNKIALNSAWDADLLRIELTNIMAMDIDIDLTGFEVGEVNVILDSSADPDDDAIPAITTEPRAKMGDIFELDGHRVGVGDARDVAFLREVMGDGRPADCAFLDLPYNVKIQGHANVKKQHREFAMASGEMNDDAFANFLSESVGVSVGESRDGAVHFLCMDWRHADVLAGVCAGIYGEQLNLCVWNKSNAGMGSLYRSKHELVFVYRVGGVQHLNTVELGRHGRNRTNVWDYPSVNTFAGARTGMLDLHPTMKPVAMVADAIKDVTKRGDRVLDIFLGSGTTLIAAERTGRQFRGIDIDPLYVDIAIDRWVAMTNGSPKLVREGA